jgi:hypothetical protein
MGRKIKIWAVEKALNPHIREWEGEAIAKRTKLDKGRERLKRQINACKDQERMGDLLRRSHLTKTALQKVGDILEL